MTDQHRVLCRDLATLDPQRMDAARLLIVLGRSWLPLTSQDIERGAYAIESDPHYRSEIVRCARMWVEAKRFAGMKLLVERSAAVLEGVGA
jgi:hypothetical protein